MQLRSRRRNPVGGLQQLRQKRGSEDVTFADVADHLAEYALANPEEAGVVDGIARYLAAVEDTSHDHPSGTGAGSP